jgi:thiol-disulfide isomerase/thioredoxin
MDIETFKDLLNNTNNVVVLRFYANWCNPCNSIKELCNEIYSKLPNNIDVHDINIDETLNLYVTLKRYKMLKSIPSFLVWYPEKNRDHWFVPDDNISTSDKNDIISFFNKIIKNC